jgi:uncharacterized protein YueI
MFENIKKAFSFYKEIKHVESQKKRLVKNKIDYDYLQFMIDNAEQNKVEMVIELADHTKITIRPMKKERQNVVFTGD